MTVSCKSPLPPTNGIGYCRHAVARFCLRSPDFQFDSCQNLIRTQCWCREGEKTNTVLSPHIFLSVKTRIKEVPLSSPDLLYGPLNVNHLRISSNRSSYKSDKLSIAWWILNNFLQFFLHSKRRLNQILWTTQTTESFCFDRTELYYNFVGATSR